MSMDPQVRAYLDRVATSGRPANADLDPLQARAQNEALAPEAAGPVLPVSRVVDDAVAGVAVRIYDPDPVRTLPTLVYLHGGGWVIGSLDTHDSACRALARRTPCRVVSVAYRLAPEHRFPTAVDDSWAVLSAIAREASAPVAAGGDSAGGNLAAVLALRARNTGLPLALQLLIYPVTDSDQTTRSYRAYGDGHGMTQRDMEWFFHHYVGDGDRRHPEIAPLRAASLAGVAPAHVQVAELDVLHDEGVAYAERLRRERVPVTLTEMTGMVHGYIRQAGLFDRTRDAWDDCASALNTAFFGPR